MEPSDALQAFRYSFYDCLHRRSDALFELTDALLTADAAPSPVHLSLQPAHRRGWGSLYAALAHGRIGAEALRNLLARHHPLAGSGATPVYAVDVSVWPRCDAERSSPDRGFYYHPSRHSAGQPIVAGWAYQFIARLNFVRESWTAPVDVERVRPWEDANEVAAGQVKALLGRLGKEGSAPLFIFDAGYDPVKVQQGLEGSTCQVLVRLRAGRCFYADPGLAGPPAPTGRPRRHGPKMKCADPSTWPEPSAEYACEDTGYGAVRVRASRARLPGRGCIRRSGRTKAGEAAGLYRSCAGCWCWWRSRGCPAARGGASHARPLWLWWHGPGEPDLDLLWRAYVRRFELEHTSRFLKRTLGWTTPRVVRHPGQAADRWRWLVMAAFTQLRLARACLEDRRLPWERRYDTGRLTPIRVHRAVSALLAELGTPAKPPKPCGRSPGRPKGRLSGRAKRYPAVKKAA